MTEKTSYAERAYNGWNRAVEHAFPGKTAKERILIFTAFCLSAITGVIFTKGTPAGFPSFSSPVTDAFLCASGNSFPGAFLGAVYGAVRYGRASVFRIVSLFTLFFLRLAGGLWLRGNEKTTALFCEPVRMKAGISVLFALVQSAFYVSTGFEGKGYSEEALVTLLYCLLVLPLTTLLFLPFFEGCPVKRPGRSYALPRFLYEASMTFFFAILCRLSVGIRYAGCSLGVLIALFLTFVTAYRGGFVRGGITGAVLGLVSAAVYTPSFVVSGVLFGIFSVLGSFPSAGISAFAASVIAVTGTGIEAFAVFVPQIIFAVAVASPVLRYGFLPKRFPYPQRKTPDELEAISAAEMKAMAILDGKEQLYRLSGAFRELSETLGNVPPAENPDVEILTRDLRSSVCSSCPLEPICWMPEASKTAESFRKMIFYPHIDRSGDYVSTHCIRLSDIKREAGRLSKLYSGKKTPHPHLAFGHEYGAVSEILSDLAEITEKEYRPDKDAENAVYRAAAALGFRADLINVVGDREKRIYAFGVTPERASASAEKLREAFSAACKVEFAAPVYTSDGGGCMVFSQAEKIRAEAFRLSSAKSGESVSGDFAVTFGVPEGKYFSIISDGMGSGKEAYESSRLTCAVMEKLLRSGIRKTSAVRIAGDILLSRGSEVFSTVDLLEVDLVTGKASFLKSGAASSYIVRNSAVYKISASALPVGITKEIFPEEATFELLPGDLIIMLSDGVIPDEDESNLISGLVSGKTPDPKTLAGMIMEKAAEKTKHADDMTVTVIKTDEIVTKEKTA